MAVRKVLLFSVPVSDQTRAKEFYVGVLGFDLVADMPMGPEQRWVQVAPKGAATSITLVTWFDSMPAGSVQGIVLETDNLEADIDLLTGRGVKFDGAVQEQPWGRFVTFADPDGNGFILQATAGAAD
jgi:catechol 2,3-dioxygenase-like lactoylglutathione lyase family enzyme